MTQAADDALLIERSRKGDRGAFDILVSRYQDRAYKYAFRLVRDPNEAADIVADAFVRVYNALHHFRGQSAFSTWLYRIVTNCFLDARKKTKNKVHLSLEQTMAVEDGEVSRQVEDLADGPEALLEKSAREDAVQFALDDMPEFQKAMLVMYHVEGMSYEEISASLDLPIGTVKSRLNRARLALREKLAGNMELFQIG